MDMKANKTDRMMTKHINQSAETVLTLNIYIYYQICGRDHGTCKENLVCLIIQICDLDLKKFNYLKEK